MEPSEKPIDSGSSATPERKGVLAFVQSLKAPQKTPEETTPKPSSSTQGFSPKGPLHHHFAEFSWSEQQNKWLQYSFFAHCALAALIWIGFFLAFTRPTYIQVGAPTLEESAKTFYATDYTKVDPQLIYDQLSYFTITNLSLLHQIDAYSNSIVDVLKGMVDPTIIEKAKKYAAKNKEAIQKQKFVQNLIINRVLNPIPNPQTGTVALFAEGYFSIALQTSDGEPVNRITPYRAKCILRFTPVSSLNLFPFTLENLDEVIGADAVQKWDEDNKKFFNK